MNVLSQVLVVNKAAKESFERSINIGGVKDRFIWSFHMFCVLLHILFYLVITPWYSVKKKKKEKDRKKKEKKRKHHTCVLPVKVSPWQFNLVKTLLQVMAAVFFPFILLDLIKSLRSSPHSDTHFPLPRSLHLHPTHTIFPLSQCSVHTSGFSIPATKPQQQGGNDPATTAVMMESVGGLAGSLTLPNKSPNNSVNIRADPATRSNTLTHGWPPRMTLGNLSVGQENCCWPAHSVYTGALECMFSASLWTRVLARRTQQQLWQQ